MKQPPLAATLAMLTLAIPPIEAESLELERLEPITRVPFAAGQPNQGRHSADLRRAVSADGRFFTFSTSASALAPGLADHNGQSDVFVVDRQNPGNTLVSHCPGDLQRPGDDGSSGSMISADGRFIAFTSDADDLGGGATDFAQVYLYDRISTELTLVTANAAGTGPGNNASLLLDISADGRYLAIRSEARNLIAGLNDNALTPDLFLWDRQTGDFELVTRRHDAPATTSPTEPGDLTGTYPGTELSSDGRYLMYRSNSSTLVAGDSGSHLRILLFDRDTGSNVLVSRTPSLQSVRAELARDLSADGRFVLFASTSPASQMVSGAGTGAAVDLFLFDRTTGSVELISRAADPALAEGNGESFDGWLSDDGQFVHFISEASNLVSGVSDTGGGADLFRRDRSAGTTTLLTRDAANPAAAADAAELRTTRGAAASDGSSFTFESEVPLVAGHSGSEPFLYRYESSSGLWTLLNRVGSSTAAAAAFLKALSPDGEFSLWTTEETAALVGGADPQPESPDLLAYAGEASLVNEAAVEGVETPHSADLSHSRMDENARLIGFTASRPLCGSTPVPDNQLRACLLHRASGEMRLLSHRWDDPAIATNASSMRLLEFSSDGSRLLLHSSDPNHAPSDSGQTCDLFLYDPAQRSFELISHRRGQPTIAAGGSCQLEADELGAPATENYGSLLSDDLARVVFASDSPALDSLLIDTNEGTDIFVRHRLANFTQPISVRPSGQPTTGNGRSWAPRISGDGRYVLYASAATNLIDGFLDGNGSQDDLFLHALDSAERRLVSHAASSPTQSGNGGLAGAFHAISANGRFVVFTSFAGDLMAGVTDSNGSADVYLYDRSSDTTTLVSHAAGEPLRTANLDSYAQALSSNGRYVLFVSRASDIVPGVGGFELYRWDRQTGAMQLVSHRSLEPRVPAGSAWGNASADGSRVLFTSHTPDIVPGTLDTNGDRDLFIWHAADGAVELASRRFDPPAATGKSRSPYTDIPQFNRKGNLALFASIAGNLIEHDGNQGIEDHFLAIFTDPLFSDGFESGSTSAWTNDFP